MKEKKPKKRERRLPNYCIGVRTILGVDKDGKPYVLRQEEMTPEEIKAANKACN